MRNFDTGRTVPSGDIAPVVGPRDRSRDVAALRTVTVAACGLTVAERTDRQAIAVCATERVAGTPPTASTIADMFVNGFRQRCDASPSRGEAIAEHAEHDSAGMLQRTTWRD